jgi:3-hydroxybutyryl-CoA dehydratase
MSDIRRKATEGLRAGDTFTVSRTFTLLDVHLFADISRDYNPVHFDARFAGLKNFSEPICHGLLIGSLITEIGGQLGWLASGMAFRFLKPVYPGETVRCDFTITDLDERGRAQAKAIFSNGDGLTVATADLTGILPGDNEKEVLKQMLQEGDPTNKAGT